MKLFYWIATSVALGLMLIYFTGCTFVIGKHPHSFIKTAQCYPCIEATQNFGAGVMILPDEKKWYRKFTLGWRYE